LLLLLLLPFIIMVIEYNKIEKDREKSGWKTEIMAAKIWCNQYSHVHTNHTPFRSLERQRFAKP
jgi:hypothetical protein